MKETNGQNEIILKTRREIDRLGTAGSLVAKILHEVSTVVQPGIRISTLEKVCAERVAFYGKEHTINKYPDFPTHLSVSVNDTAVHGVPDRRLLRNGDIVTLDLVLLVDEWYGDSALTVPVGTIDPVHGRLIESAMAATQAGIACAKAGNRIGDIGCAVQQTAEKYGAVVFESLVGHGIGRSLHEGPVVFMKGEAEVGQPIVPGMVFTIEPVLTKGRTSYCSGKDGHSLKTEDGEFTAMFEHMVAVMADRSIVLTEFQ